MEHLLHVFTPGTEEHALITQLWAMGWTNVWCAACGLWHKIKRETISRR